MITKYFTFDLFSLYSIELIKKMPVRKRILKKPFFALALEYFRLCG